MVSRLNVTVVNITLHFDERRNHTRARIDPRQENRMSKIEYKTILLPYKTGIFQSDSIEVADALNKVGVDGWRLSQIVLPSTMWGRANTMVAILERASS